MLHEIFHCTDRASNARQGECGGLATTEGPGKTLSIDATVGGGT
jgi:hypothetical protein